MASGKSLMVLCLAQESLSAIDAGRVPDSCIEIAVLQCPKRISICIRRTKNMGRKESGGVSDGLLQIMPSIYHGSCSRFDDNEGCPNARRFSRFPNLPIDDGPI